MLAHNVDYSSESVQDSTASDAERGNMEQVLLVEQSKGAIESGRRRMYRNGGKGEVAGRELLAA